MKYIKSAFSILLVSVLFVSVMTAGALALENEACCSSNNNPCTDCYNDSIVYRAIGCVPSNSATWAGIELLNCHHDSVPRQEDNIPHAATLNVLRWYSDGTNDWYYVAAPRGGYTLYGWVHENSIIIEQELTSLD